MSSKSSPIISKEHKYVLNDTEFTLVDYCFSHAIIDDKVYANNVEIWKQIPRGKCEVYAEGELIHTLQGLRKFGDNTDTNFGYPESHDLVKAWPKGMKCITTVKENGECFHLSAFMYKQKLYVLLGSKLVHIILDYTCFSQANIETQLEAISQQQPQRTSYAVKMARCLFAKILPNIEPHFIVWLSLGKFTLVGEYINPEHEHVIAQSEETIRFYAITQTQFDESSPYTCVPFLEAQKLLSSFGLTTVEYQVATNLQELKDIQTTTMNKTDIEGTVEYYVHDHRTVMMYKYKSKHYSVLRTIREIFNHGCRGPSKLLFRLRDYHIPLTEEEIQTYCEFYKWLVASYKPADTIFSSVLYEQFFPLYKEGKHLMTDKTSKHAVYVVMVGVPGSGKSTLGSQLMMNGVQNGIHSVYADQDMYNRDVKQFFGACDTYLQIMVREQEPSILINGRCNTTHQMRRDSLSFVDLQQTSVVFVVLNNQPDADFYTQRIEHREYHTSLFANQAKQVVTKFQQTYEPINEEDCKLDGYHVVFVDPKADPLHQIEQVWNVIMRCFEPEHKLTMYKPLQFYHNWICCRYVGIQVELQAVHAAVKSLKLFNECAVAQSLRIPATKHHPHVTLVHSSEFTLMAHAALLWSCMVGECVKVFAEGMYWNERICALKVRVKGASKPFLHITYKKANYKVENVESNQFAIQSPATKCELFEAPVELIGLVKRF
jgi:hypothetical protein